MSCYNPDPNCDCRQCGKNNISLETPVEKNKVQKLKNKTLKQINKEFKKAEEKYKQQLKILQETCQHQFQTFKSYDGTDYTCKKCGYWK